MNPEFGLAWSGVAFGSVPCLAPSESQLGVFKPTRAVGTAGSVQNVTVCGSAGSKFVHSTVSPTWTRIVSGKNLREKRPELHGPKRSEARAPLSGPRYRGSNPCLSVK
jgi:hypothetical protein